MLKKIIVVKIALVAVSHLFDLIKDSLILVEISKSQGGLDSIMNENQQPYIRWVSNHRCLRKATLSFKVLNLHLDLLCFFVLNYCPVGAWMCTIPGKKTTIIFHKLPGRRTFQKAAYDISFTALSSIYCTSRINFD